MVIKGSFMSVKILLANTSPNYFLKSKINEELTRKLLTPCVIVVGAFRPKILLGRLKYKLRAAFSVCTP